MGKKREGAVGIVFEGERRQLAMTIYLAGI